MTDAQDKPDGLLDPSLPWEMCGCGRVVPANQVCVCPLGDMALEVFDRRYGIDRTPKPCDVCGEELVEPLMRTSNGKVSGHPECIS